jgi:hypothetical protein
MSTTVNLIEAIRARLDDNIDTIGAKVVRLGSKEGARKGSNFPVVNINLKKGSELPFATRGMFVQELVLEISLIDKKLISDLNRYYKADDSTGIMFAFDNLLNVLDKASDGSMDLTFDATASDFAKQSFEVNEIEDLIEITFEIKIKSKQYLKGSR